ncbi:MAG TPA: hypothetical protein VFH88_10170, partial [Candidatus Krumholzibacteria bacterium]|nr:hypothetical protein [Candidatus Krumholzibacteria bacterium]
FCANALKNRPDIMAARPTHVPAIMSLPYVRWLCPLQPELKYDPELLSGSDSVKLSVRPLVGAHDYCRRDLDRCGARSQYQWVTYLATMPAESVRCVASLWWVLGIERYSEPIED